MLRRESSTNKMNRRPPAWWSLDGRRYRRHASAGATVPAEASLAAQSRREPFGIRTGPGAYRVTVGSLL